jgi:pyruvate formate lyase activating enzyme
LKNYANSGDITGDKNQVVGYAALALYKNNPQFNNLKEAYYYQELGDSEVQCLLCPRECILAEGERGICGVRQNIKGKLYTLVYGRPVAVHVDPIEKKPISHMLPGSKSFSIATAGCNLGCRFCQNWQISQVLPEEIRSYDLPPEKVVQLALENNCQSIAYTYSEPTIFYEYMIETAKLAHQKGLKNIYVTSGYINPEPLRELCKYIDAANLDIKGFTEDYYRKYCLGKLQPVLESAKIMQEEGVWIELTNLILPTINDDMEVIREMCEWIIKNLGPDVPLYFSRFYPAYKITHLPPTPVETLEKAREIALGVGLHYVYIGNVPGNPAEHTYCPNCGKLLIQRVGFFVTTNNLNEDRCPSCGEKIPGIWK